MEITGQVEGHRSVGQPRTSPLKPTAGLSGPLDRRGPARLSNSLRAGLLEEIAITLQGDPDKLAACAYFSFCE